MTPTDDRTLLAFALLAATIAGYAEALARLRRHERRRGDQEGRWSGYARDAVNLAAAVLLFGAFVLGGYALPSALLLGIALAFVAYVVDFAAGRWLGLPSARLVVIAAALTLGAVALVLAASVGPGVDALLAQTARR